MDGLDDPVTESQLIQLRRFGYEADRALTRVEAARMIGRLRRGEGGVQPSDQNRTARHMEHDVHHSGTSTEETGQPIALAATDPRRQEFWMDTCRDPIQMQIHNEQVMQLYIKHGCRFNVPNHEQAQEILEALDGAMPGWDQEHPELFYQTLEMNFPQLLRYV